MSQCLATRDVKDGLKALLNDLHLALHHLRRGETFETELILRSADRELVSMLNGLRTIQSDR